MLIIIRTGIDMIVQNLKNHFSFGLITGGGMVRVGPGYSPGTVWVDFSQVIGVGLFRIAKTNLFSTNLKNLLGLKSQSFANRNKIKKVVIPFRQVSLQLTLN